jgi:hypothetical protein
MYINGIVAGLTMHRSRAPQRIVNYGVRMLDQPLSLLKLPKGSSDVYLPTTGKDIRLLTGKSAL